MQSEKFPEIGLSLRLYRFFLRAILFVYLQLLNLANKLRTKRVLNKQNLDILITGTFYSDQWLITHLKPLALSSMTDRVRMVAVTPVPKIKGVEAIYPPGWLVKCCGSVPARLIMFSWCALTSRPDVIGGFHLLLNGLLGILLAKLTGARSLYICGGGPREVAGGGYKTENRIFNRIKYFDGVLEQQLIQAVSYCDLVVTMGTSAVTYFKSHGVDTHYEIVAGGFSSEEFYPAEQEPEFDLILIGRLSSVKQVNVFLKSISKAKDKIPSLNAVVVGDGPDINELKNMAQSLGLGEDVFFAGWQNNIGEWLRKARVFMLTSSSEGLSQALIQAMMTGVPAIVSDVGDLGDLVKDGENGYLVKDLTDTEFSFRIVQLLSKEGRLNEFGELAYKASQRFVVENVVIQWDAILKKV